jgi:ubiquinone/menaquinone biosynthesis C-methylase UbiE
MHRGDSLVFDRAVEFYDRTRSLSSATMGRVVPLLRRELGAGPCLEIGVGTGRIALPLSASGTDMVGLDLSQPMMQRLVANAGNRLPFPLLVADAGSLPLRDDSFAGALAVHVLHLIPEWRRAVGELARVVRPGGAIVIDIGLQTEGPWRDLLIEFARAAGIPGHHRGLNEIGELDEFMEAIGATHTAFETIEEMRSASYTKTIAALEAGTYSITWAADEADRREAAESTRRWATERYGDLDQHYEYRLKIALRSYRLGF